MIDGYGWPLWGIGDLGLLEVTRHRIDPGFFRSEIGLLMNEASFGRLGEEQQAVLQEEAIEAENWFEEFLREVNAAELALQEEAGIEAVTFPPEETARIPKEADEAAWAEIVANSPEYGERIKELTYRAP